MYQRDPFGDSGRVNHRAMREHLDSGQPSAHNGFVRRRLRRFFVLSSLMLVVTSLAASPLAALRASAAAMACCAKTDYTCAGVSAPDDCCRQMGHTASGVTPGTLETARASSVLAIAIVPPLAARDAASSPVVLDSVSAFTRPHDPPYLHSYSLLI
jgi:hypothetical protein